MSAPKLPTRRQASSSTVGAWRSVDRGKFQSGLGAELGADLGGGQGVTAQLKEALAGAYLLQAEHLPQQARDALLQRATRLVGNGGTSYRPHRRGQRPAVELPVCIERECVEAARRGRGS